MNILIVVDMQNDFITGSLGTKEAEAILPKVLEKIRTYRPEQIFVTQDTHPDNYLETNEGRHLPVAHCIAGSEGHALIRWWRRRWKAYLQTTLSASPPLAPPCWWKSSRPPSGPKPRRSSWWVCAPASACCPMPSCAKQPSRKAMFPWTLPAAPASRPSPMTRHFLHEAVPN